ncbi:CvpA family protein [Ruminococcaceae bacterium OttesenSCG-928-D13]|nr:CvpA family protein [Ruminococcaceae bacterium OttesenSCG-928-D13]
MLLQSIILDLVVLAVLALCAAFYARRGLLASIFSLLGTLAALILAGLAANYLAPAIFNTFFRPGMEQRVADTIAESGVMSLEQLLAAVLGFLPESLLEGVAERISAGLDFTAPNVAALVVEQVVAPLVVPFIIVIVFFVLFSLLRLLMRLLRSLLVGVNRIPAVGAVNSALGAVVGIAIGALYIYLAFCVIWAYDSVNPASPIGETYFANSLSFNLLAGLNFFA